MKRKRRGRCREGRKGRKGRKKRSEERWRGMWIVRAALRNERSSRDSSRLSEGVQDGCYTTADEVQDI